MQNLLTRRRFLFGMAAILGGGYADLRYVEPRWLRVSKVKVELPGKKAVRPVRILQLSDFHASDIVPIDFIRKAIKLGIKQDPHITCLTGDLITGRIPDRPAFVEALRMLSDHGPCFASMGNHDGGLWARRFGGYEDRSEITRLLKDSGITVLHNRATQIEANGRDLELVGLGDIWAQAAEPWVAFGGMQTSPQVPRLVLSHNPDSKKVVAEHDWDLMLCGHTHGGQISLPLLGTPFAPVTDRRYVAGLNPWKGRQIYTTRGVGSLNGLRFNCRPEVSVLELG
jgi:predicted MPP superfamily phosphohydrolase